jgi:predicted transcriptional regulator
LGILKDHYQRRRFEMKTIGYLEGTDVLFLTKLVARGIGTLPLGNGADNHGKYIGLLSRSDNISLVIGYLHKVIPTAEHDIAPKDMLYSCMLHKIPVMLIVPEELQEDAKKILKEAANHVMLVDTKNMWDQTMKILS